MWLPDTVYARVPRFWLLMGLMFFAFGLYLGFEYDLIFVYLATGAFCVLRSLWIFKIRREFKKIPFKTIDEPTSAETPADQSAETPADQSAESNPQSAESNPAAPEASSDTVKHETPEHSKGAPSF